jgi:hypothetical protein
MSRSPSHMVPFVSSVSCFGCSLLEPVCPILESDRRPHTKPHLPIITLLHHSFDWSPAPRNRYYGFTLHTAFNVLLKLNASRPILFAADSTATASYRIAKTIRREVTINTNHRHNRTKWIQTTTEGISAKIQCTYRQENQRW